MSEAAATVADVNAPPPTRLRRLMAGVSRWTTGSRLRMALSCVAALSVLVVMFAVWSLLAHAAVDSLTPVSIADAFVALDESRYDDARAIIGDLQDKPATPELLSGALFVLGASKAREAEEEATSDRRRALYQVASRYLQQALQRELPPFRRRQALLLLGKSMVHGGEPAAGIAALEEALTDPEQPPIEIHELLVSAYLDAPEPQLQQAIAHNERVLADPDTTPARRGEAMLRHADLLLRLGQTEKAREIVAQIDGELSLAVAKSFLLGRINLAEARRLPAGSQQRSALLDDATAQLREAQRADNARAAYFRQSMYWLAECYLARGDHAAAEKAFDNVAGLFTDQPEALAATLTLADFSRQSGDITRALDHYRTVLATVRDSAAYVNPLLSLAELKKRLSTAVQEMLDAELFAETLRLVEMLDPVFTPAEVAELEANTWRAWGAEELASTNELDDARNLKLKREGRRHLRAAGVAFMRLAEMHYASAAYTRHLWAAADCFYRGQSFSSAAEALRKFLHEEAEQSNAKALLMMGQCDLAMRQFEDAIETLEECIELYPRDSSTYQARLEAARAYQQLGDLQQAEQLLVANLSDTGLTPQALEWQHSLFDLGRLLYEAQRYEEAVAKLEEAVLRYPQSGNALIARYTIARAFHGAAEEPAARLREAKTESERQKNRKLFTEYLEGALAAYIDVQREITLRGASNVDSLARELLLNCYMMKGSVLYQLRRFEDARQAYGSVVTSYENQPIVLEALVQVANCWRRLNQPAQARLTLQRAKLALDRLPTSADYLATTNHDRQQWEYLIAQMSEW